MVNVLYEFNNEDLVDCVLKARPSTRNKSPYVADVNITEEDRDAIAHVPSLNLGGKCISGSRCLMKFARKTTGKKERVGSDEVSKKYGTPKCELHSCLVKYKNTWIGAHPKIGEDIAANLLSEGSTYGPIHSSKIVKCLREVSGVANTDMRTDFVLEHEDGTHSIVEVKTVVDSDSDIYDEGTNGAIFPWGNKNQKYNGQKVVSARAIKHVTELTSIGSGEKNDEKYPELRACVLFIVVRDDCVYFRPHKEACSVFAEALENANDNNVNIVAHSIKWANDKDGNMKGYDNGNLHVVLG